MSDETKRADCYAILKMMKQATRTEPRMLGSSIIGFGSHHYKYASGHEGDTCRIGFSPRKSEITLYLLLGFDDVAPLLKKLGRRTPG